MFHKIKWMHQQDEIHRIEQKLASQEIDALEIGAEMRPYFQRSAILFLVGQVPLKKGSPLEPCLILNKRSPHVRQPGDLCCPGGGFSLPMDHFLGRLLRLPYSPLRRWSGWSEWRRKYPSHLAMLQLVLAAAMREAWEEMRLNPLQTRFLGPLPAQHLVLLNRTLHPVAAWVSSFRFLKPNWEVTRFVTIPFRELLDLTRYARFRPQTVAAPGVPSRMLHKNYLPCFMHQDQQGLEVLWGATFRVVENFSKLIFGFDPPPFDTLPIVEKYLDTDYPNPASP